MRTRTLTVAKTLLILKDSHSFSIAIMHTPQDPAASKHTAEVLAQLALSRYH
jgi:hypothetical protein